MKSMKVTDSKVEDSVGLPEWVPLIYVSFRVQSITEMPKERHGSLGSEVEPIQRCCKRGPDYYLANVHIGF